MILTEPINLFVKNPINTFNMPIVKFNKHKGSIRQSIVLICFIIESMSENSSKGVSEAFLRR